MSMLKMSRRSMLGFCASTIGFPILAAQEKEREFYKIKNGRINQSVVHWCFSPMSVEELARVALKMGVKSVELVGTEHWKTLKELGMTCAIAGSHGFLKGFAHKEEHNECLAILTKRIEECAAAGVPSVITFSGMRRGISDDEATKNMIDGLKKIAAHAEKNNVTVCLEMLNSKVNEEMKGHPDYWCDNIDVAVDIVKKVGSPRVKVLFDIYHVQIMNGDIIRRIRQYSEYIGHYHTAGNPGRNEIDDTQEINYPAVMKAIAETRYKGFVGQEFVPLRDKVASLNEAVRICDV
ncbi:MAG: hydroxypyruvate isomerase family protein [Verrucomicrobiia bacterium]